MMSLLVVDDEMLIADGLYSVLQDVFAERLAVWHCYCAADAKNIMDKHKIDILLTDINMPDVSGLELHRWMLSRWSMCRVIYLTGYSDFGYARKAVEQHAFAYVLKGEGDEKIIEAVERAIADIAREEAALFSTAQIAQARPLFIRTLMHQLIFDGNMGNMELSGNLANWNIPLSVDKGVLLGYCFFRYEPTQIETAMSVLEKLGEKFASFLASDFTKRSFHILCQTDARNKAELFSSLMESMVHILQSKGIQVTAVLLDKELAWQELPSANVKLLNLLGRDIPGIGETRLFHWEEDTAPSLEMELKMGSVWRKALDIIRSMNEYLLTGQRDLYFEEENHLLHLILVSQPSRDEQFLLCRSVCFTLQSAGNIFPEAREMLADIQLMNDPDSANSILNNFDKFHSCAEFLFNCRSRASTSRTDLFLGKFHAYIKQHLSGDLSLTTLADVFHFHPVYLSRMYKEATGMSMSDFITNARLEKSYSLLSESTIAVAAIAEKTGFASANYFCRWFRKKTGISPQEYRCSKIDDL
jgi:two-component system, response regulator YesN